MKVIKNNKEYLYDKKTIAISEATYQKLLNIKENKKLKRLDMVIDYLLALDEIKSE